MLNYLWTFLMLLGILYGAFTGTLSQITEAALSSAKEAVALCITMVGVMSFWMGMMKIAEASGLLTSATRLIRPLFSFLFPNLPLDHPARTHISTNLIANFFGLGWAATPAGLKAMESLRELEEERRNTTSPLGLPSHVASKEMCTFLVLNISSLQLIPVNIIAYRSQYQSANPGMIIGPAILATFLSTLVAVMFCKSRVLRRQKP